MIAKVDQGDFGDPEIQKLLPYNNLEMQEVGVAGRQGFVTRVSKPPWMCSMSSTVITTCGLRSEEMSSTVRTTERGATSYNHALGSSRSALRSRSEFMSEAGTALPELRSS